MMVASISVARILGKASYGELGMIQSTVGTFGVFAGFGLGLTATKHVAEFRQTSPERAGRIIGLSSVVAVVTGGVMAIGLFLLAPWLATHTINAPHLTGALRIGALILFITALNGAQTGALSGFEAFKTIAHVNLLIGLLSFPILIYGTWIGGLTGAVWALTINLVFNWLLNHIALRKEMRRYRVPVAFRNCSRELPLLWSFVLPVVCSSSLVGPVTWTCGAILVNQVNGYSEMGIYSAATQCTALVTFMVMILNSVLLPILTNERQHGNHASQHSFHYVHTATFLVATPITVLAILFAPAIAAMFGSDFSKGQTTFILVLAATGISSIGSPAGTLLQSRGMIWAGFWMNMFWAVVIMGASYVLVPSYKAAGLGLALLIAHTLLALGGYLYQTPMLPKGALKRTYLGMAIVIVVAMLRILCPGARG